MAEPDAFDPTRALDGWRAPAPAPALEVQDLALAALLQADLAEPGETEVRLVAVVVEPDAFDPTHALDGWHPPAPAPLDLELRSLLHAGRPAPDAAKQARLKARGYEMVDVEDIELPDTPPTFAVLEAAVLVIAPLPLIEDRHSTIAPANEPPAAPEAAEAPPAAAAESVDEPEPQELAEPAAERPETVPVEVAEAPTPEAQADPQPPADDLAQPAIVEDAKPVEAQLTDAGSDDERPEAMPVEVAEKLAAEAEPELQPPAEDKAPPAIAEAVEIAEASSAEGDEEPIEAISAEFAQEPAPEWEADLQPPAEEMPAAAAGEIEPDEALPLVAEQGEERPEAMPAKVAEAPPPADAVELPALVTEAAAPMAAAPEPPLPAERVVLPEAPLPPAATAAPVLDFQAAPPPATPDAGWLADIKLSEVPPPSIAVDTPVLDFRSTPPPAGPDLRQLLADLELPEVLPPPSSVATPVLDLPPPPPAPDPRLLTRWQPHAWTAQARRIRGAGAEVVQTVQGPRVENHAPQWLCALWPPQREDAPLLGRWPEMAALVDAETAFGALHQLLAELPAEARLWPAQLETDWALVADLVLRQDAGLRPTQARALRELAEAERGASAARINDGYAPRGRVARRRA